MVGKGLLEFRHSSTMLGPGSTVRTYEYYVFVNSVSANSYILSSRTNDDPLLDLVYLCMNWRTKVEEFEY